MNRKNYQYQGVTQRIGQSYPAGNKKRFCWQWHFSFCFSFNSNVFRLLQVQLRIGKFGNLFTVNHQVIDRNIFYVVLGVVTVKDGVGKEAICYTDIL